MSQQDSNTIQLNVSLKGDSNAFDEELGVANELAVPTMWGMPLKYVS
jgi:hypothetical protein